MALTVYCWLLRLYPGSYREEVGGEMSFVFHEARSALPPGLAVKINFYGREFSGLLSGALRAHLDRLFGPAIPSARCDMPAHSRFRRSTLLLMIALFAGVVLALAEAIRVAGGTLATVWPSLGALLAFLLLSMCGAAAVVFGILHSLRRGGVHRLENIQSCTYFLESDRKR